MSLYHLVTRIYGYANALGSQIALFFDGKKMKLPYQISTLEFSEQVNLPSYFPYMCFDWDSWRSQLHSR